MKKAMKKALILLLAPVIVAALLACASQTQVQGPYDDTVERADMLIEVPTLRQYGGYTCGTTCVQMLMNWLFPYEGDRNLTAYEEALGTTEEAGTPPDSILRFFDENGVTAVAKEPMTVSEMVAALDSHHPILMCMQAWSSAEDGSYNTSDPSDVETYLTEGHWVICVGYRQLKSGYRFFFNDPACVGHCLLDEAELDTRWIDMDAGGRIYEHYGIEIVGTTDYDSNGAFHLD